MCRFAENGAGTHSVFFPRTLARTAPKGPTAAWIQSADTASHCRRTLKWFEDGLVIVVAPGTRNAHKYKMLDFH
jgi:hypothetical protein